MVETAGNNPQKHVPTVATLIDRIVAEAEALISRRLARFAAAG